MRLTIADIANDFPDYRVGLVIASGLRIADDRPAALDAAIAEAEARVTADLGGRDIPSIPELHDWRRAYRAFGIKKTSYRSSVERLVRSITSGRGLPRINALVDTYNLLSVNRLVPVGADDLDRVDGPLAFRYSRDGDTFLPLGAQDPQNDPPKAGEVVYADATKVLCRRWNWYQDARSPVTTATSNAVLTVQAMGAADVDAACAELAELLRTHVGATVDYAIADAGTPEVSVGG